MTRAPFVMGKASHAFNRQTEMFDSTIGWRFINKKLADQHYPYSMGETAENVAKQWKIGREEQDLFGLASQEKYFAALSANKWAEEIAPLEVLGGKDEKIYFEKDEQPRHTSMEKLAALRPAFIKDGTVTAGNSAGINDGAAAMLLCQRGGRKKIQPETRRPYRQHGGCGRRSCDHGYRTGTSHTKALQRAGLTVKDLDLVELNEAFAAQSLACIRDLGLDTKKINVNGGSIAIGHPLGCSGVRISTTLLHEMKRKDMRYALATMCVGVGQGAAVVYEKI